MHLIYALKQSSVFSWVRNHLYPLSAISILIALLIDPNRSSHYSFFLLAVAVWGISKDKQAVSWKRFLPFGLPLLLFPILLWRYFPPVWNQVVYWQLGYAPHLFDWNALFQSIPGNDGWIFRVIQTPWLTEYFRWIYANGFTLPVLIPVYRAFLAKDWCKMLHYELSAHVLQFFLIFPFYLTIRVNEVWWVLGDPDGMARHLSPAEAQIVVQNCFPSMHTSVAFAMLLLALREKDRLFRMVWVVFGFSVIYSTLYLEIHWVIDVIGGLLLGYASVKLGDWIIARMKSKQNVKQEKPAETSQLVA